MEDVESKMVIDGRQDSECEKKQDESHQRETE